MFCKRKLLFHEDDVEQNIKVLALPPNISHCAQHLNKNLFSSFKEHLNKQMRKFLRQSRWRPLEKSHYNALFNVCSLSESASTSGAAAASSPAKAADYNEDDYEPEDDDDDDDGKKEDEAEAEDRVDDHDNDGNSTEKEAAEAQDGGE